MEHFFDNPDGVLLIAHRGHSVDGHENSRHALRLAAEKGADACEIDLRLSADGVMVVFHDATLDEASTATGAVASHGWDHLRTVRHRLRGDGTVAEPLCRIEELLDLAASLQMNLVVEIKDAFSTDQITSLLALVSRAGMAPRIVYSSFDLPQLMQLREMDPEARTLGLLHGRVPDPAAVAKAAGLTALTMEFPETAILDAHRLVEVGIHATLLVKPRDYYVSAGARGRHDFLRIVKAIEDGSLGVLFCDDVDWGRRVREFDRKADTELSKLFG